MTNTDPLAFVFQKAEKERKRIMDRLKATLKHQSPEVQAAMAHSLTPHAAKTKAGPAKASYIPGESINQNAEENPPANSDPMVLACQKAEREHQRIKNRMEELLKTGTRAAVEEAKSMRPQLDAARLEVDLTNERFIARWNERQAGKR